MSKANITAQNKPLGAVLSNFYDIPDYQREYVWRCGTSHENPRQVDVLLRDLFEAYDSDFDSGYFIGSFVVCSEDQMLYTVVDGQQRLTTIFVLLEALVCRLEDDLGVTAESSLRGQLRAPLQTDSGDKDRLRLALHYQGGQEILEALYRKEPPPPKSKKSSSSSNIGDAFRTCKDELANKFEGRAKDLVSFHNWLSKKVYVVQIETADVVEALQIFETINQRGVTLDAMDLLKNLLFKNVGPDQYRALSDQWSGFINELREADEKPLRFLRYFILAKYDPGSLKEGEVFAWFQKSDNVKNYEKRSFEFVAELRSSALNYIRFTKGQNQKGAVQPSLRNIRLLSSAARQYVILLLAGENLKSDIFNDLCLEVEKTVACYILSKQQMKSLEGKFCRWAKEVRAIKSRSDLIAFARKLEKDRMDLRPLVSDSLSTIEYSRATKGRTKYIVSRIANYVELVNSAGRGMADYVDAFRSYDLEHLLPQDPKPEAVVEFGAGEEWKDYVGRLGNLTLWKGSGNQSAGNDPFSVKRPGYVHSNVLITTLLVAPLNSTGKGGSHLGKLAESFRPYKEWTREALEEREAAMLSVAMKIWVDSEAKEV